MGKILDAEQAEDTRKNKRIGESEKNEGGRKGMVEPKKTAEFTCRRFG
jgi:hypothetical protein